MNQPYYWPPVIRPLSGTAVAGMVVGIAAWFVFCLPGLGLAAAGTALGLSLHGMKQTRTNAVRGRGFATTGLVLSILCLIPAAVFLAFVLTGAATPMGQA